MIPAMESAIKWTQGLSKDSENVCLKQQFQNICPSSFPATQLLQILLTTSFNTFLCQKGQFTLQQCHRRIGLLGKYLIITPKEVKISNSSLKYLLVQKVGFQENAYPKDKQDRSFLSPWMDLILNYSILNRKANSELRRRWHLASHLVLFCVFAICKLA